MLDSTLKPQFVEKFQASSAAAHLNGSDDQELLEFEPWKQHYTAARWAEALKVGVDEELFGERLHQATRLGRPLGDEDFATHLKQKSGRPLRPQPPGRPRKVAVKALEIGV